MFTDPITRVGGEKCSYHLPTYEALKGIAKSIYWKPTFIWYIDGARVMRRIRTQTKGMKPLDYGGGNTLAIYTYLTGDADPATGEPRAEYQVRAHFEWNRYRPELERDRNDGKHFEIAKRSLERGGRQDIFLGTRECQGYVEPCDFGSGEGEYDDLDELQYGLMFHSFDYPETSGNPNSSMAYSIFRAPTKSRLDTRRIFGPWLRSALVWNRISNMSMSNHTRALRASGVRCELDSETSRDLRSLRRTTSI